MAFSAYAYQGDCFTTQVYSEAKTVAPTDTGAIHVAAQEQGWREDPYSWRSWDGAQRENGLIQLWTSSALQAQKPYYCLPWLSRRNAVQWLQVTRSKAALPQSR